VQRLGLSRSGDLAQEALGALPGLLRRVETCNGAWATRAVWEPTSAWLLRSAQKERLVGREIHCSSGWEPAPSMIRGGPGVSRETRDLLLRKLSPRELHEETLQVAGRYARDSARLA
jgi:hypothetical protein